MKIQNVFLIACLASYSVSAQCLELPIIGAISDGSALVDSALLSSGVPLISDLPLVGELPIIDGRGVPVARGAEEGLRLAQGVAEVLAANPNTSGGLPNVGSGGTPLIDMLLSGGPTFNFLALDAVTE